MEYFEKVNIYSLASFEIFICSDVNMQLDKTKKDIFDVKVELASGGKCLRCWKVVKEVNDSAEICNRCASVIKS